jgi:excisionase family DNA binding protein
MNTSYLTVVETSNLLGVSIRTVQAWVTLGEFPNVHKLNPSKRNSPFRIPRADVEAFLSKRQAKPTQFLSAG